MDSTADLNRLLYKYLNDKVKLSGKKTSKAVNLVTEKIQRIVKYIHTKDKRFQAEVQCTGSYYQGLKVKAADEFDFNVYLAGFDGLTQWGSGNLPRYYKFNRDYDRSQNIKVHMECQFILPPILPLMAEATTSGILPQPRNEQARNVSGYSLPAPSSYAVTPSWGQTNSPRVLPSSQRPQQQGPVLPPGPPINLDKLETLPDDLELQQASVPLSTPPEGYNFFNFIPTTSVWLDCKDLIYQGDIIPFYVQRKFKKLLQEALREIEGFRGEIRQARKVHGPALTLRIPTNDETNPEISVDLAVAIPTRLPIPHENGWPRSGKRWPPQEKIDAMRKAGINFVARKPYYWQLSYANCEKELIKNIDKEGQCRKNCHRIMKSIRENYWCVTTKPVISSYHLKNLLFWECEDHPRDADWATDKIWERFNGITSRLLKCIDNGSLPHYFNPKLNLLENKDVKTLALEKKRIREFIENPSVRLSKALQ